jgi:hypothetical protein
VEEELTDLPGRRLFHLTLSQPVDHAHPGGQRFTQRMTLLHRADTAPMVLYTAGYSVPGDAFVHEATSLLDGNQLAAEHRYFEPSRPAPPNWRHLTIRQAASDLHRIVQLIRPVYPGTRWISTGASKSGMTAVYHRRFFPGDVDGTVAYVAPLSLGAPDRRYARFLETQPGTEACRRALRAVQRIALTRRVPLIAMMTAAAAREYLTYHRLGPDKAFEHAVVEVQFAFWQYLGATFCAGIPGSGASDRAVYDFVDAVSDFSFYGDPSVAFYEPYYYQAASELGYPAEPLRHLVGLQRYPGSPRAEDYAPVGVPTRYSTLPMLDVQHWVLSRGSRIVFVYGQYDPWSAGAFTVSWRRDTARYVVPAGNHGSQLLDLQPGDRAAALAALERWTGVRPSPGRAAAQSVSEVVRTPL